MRSSAFWAHTRMKHEIKTVHSPPHHRIRARTRTRTRTCTCTRTNPHAQTNPHAHTLHPPAHAKGTDANGNIKSVFIPDNFIALTYSTCSGSFGYADPGFQMVLEPGCHNINQNNRYAGFLSPSTSTLVSMRTFRTVAVTLRLSLLTRVVFDNGGGSLRYSAVPSAPQLMLMREQLLL